ncbi:hypothetical protein TYRP_021419 [Tyrophagus putrescentiae]|nr:hypothetical protein TYRP_021419 [Tyrophagus putrescentiae]
MIFSKFRRCFYSYTAELLNRPKGFWKRFYIEQFFIFAYGYSRGVYGGYIMLASSPQTRATFLSVDYSLALLHQFDALMILLLWFFGLFFHFCEVTLARLELTESDGNSSDMWRLWNLLQTEFLTVYPWYSKLFFLFEITTIEYYALRLFQLGVFFTNLSLFALVLFGGHISDLQSSLTSAIITAKAKGKRYLTRAELIGKISVKAFLADHNFLSRLLMNSNRQLLSRVMAAFALTNLPVNLYILSQLVLPGTFDALDKNAWITRAVYYVLLVVQTVMIAVAIGPLLLLPKRMHAPQRSLLVPLQYYLRGRSTRISRLKLKLDDLKLGLSFGPKVAVTIGAAREATDETAVEFFGIYSVFLLMLWKQQIKNVHQINF